MTKAMPVSEPTKKLTIWDRSTAVIKEVGSTIKGGIRILSAIL
jgi:hypothetical protein